MVEVVRYLVDGMNVIGSTPDGWWRDPDAAVHRLIEQLQAYAEATGDEVGVIFDRRPPRMRAGMYGPIWVGFARGPGPNAADRDLARRVERDTDPESLTVVTSDRALIDRVRALGAQVESSKGFRSRLEG
jgi:predicted RNA-binding protein with PIN domain